MTACWQVSAVVALDGRSAPHPRALALHLGKGLVYVGADDDLLAVGARLRARSADEALRELGRRLAPLGLGEPGRRRGVHVSRARRLRRHREPLVITSSGGDDDGSAGVPGPRRPTPPGAPGAAVRPLPA
jgi:hypothetical protein